MPRPYYLLINPWIYDFAAYDMWAKPLGLLTMAALLRRAGARVAVWDAMLRPPADDGNAAVRDRFGTGKYLRTVVEKPQQLQWFPHPYARYGKGPEALADFVGRTERPDGILVTSLMTYWYPGVFEAIGVVKRELPGVPVFLGGVYATLCYEHALRYSGADHVLPGRGEVSAARILDGTGVEAEADAGGGKPSCYPAFDLLAHGEYACILSSRGCPYHCHYCASKTLFDGFEERDPGDVEEEILHWYRQQGVRDIAFYDDALLVHSERRMVPLLESLIRRNLPLRFHTPNGLHLKEINPELARLMRRAGFRTIRLGFESSNLEWHQKTGGKVGGGDIERALRWLWEAGFERSEVGVYVLIGLPGQRYEEAEDAVRTVKGLGARCFLAEYSPIPHTAMWEDALLHSALELENEPLFHNNSLIPCGGETFTEERVRRLKRLRDER